MRGAAWVVLGVAAVAAPAPARADISVAGTYDIKIEEMANGCTPNPPITLVNKTIAIGVKGGSLTVNLETIPQMVGAPDKSGRVTAKTTKFQATTFQGLSGKYEIAGHVAADKSLELVLVAEYINSATKKAYCTQSWTITSTKPAPAK